jgi:hypothetical protein
MSPVNNQLIAFFSVFAPAYLAMDFIFPDIRLAVF